MLKLAIAMQAHGAFHVYLFGTLSCLARGVNRSVHWMAGIIRTYVEMSGGATLRPASPIYCSIKTAVRSRPGYPLQGR